MILNCNLTAALLFFYSVRLHQVSFHPTVFSLTLIECFKKKSLGEKFQLYDIKKNLTLERSKKIGH